ncbi:bacteriohemerythrin [Calditerrivibrio nitroreducens]|uniref:Methyl-accepting chemotaxis sensory transducer n=1 Tax=Calditerrivibrio nitroreducens (strain DSM 19672 / NBRC 101217 / Yu37-1) TaxID=768670 RepID=E4THP3_CALNY|nr:bacteriohemerythrin [Calditerrivibrio nitroreducens]ADR18868.1 methyl-accepting chemotaxis sensory transducer [Calditerrivibrio nitroreducens DSM 19672]
MRRFSIERMLLFFLVINGLLAVLFGLYNIYLISSLESLPKDQIQSVISQLTIINYFIVVGVPVGLVITYFVIYRTFIVRMESLNEKLVLISKGDYSLKLDDCQGVMGKVVNNINNVVDKSRHLLKTTKLNVSALGNAADELKKSQSYVLNELKHIQDSANSVSSAAEELTATSSSIVDNCRRTLDSTIELSKNSEIGISNATKLKNQINEISESIILLNKNISDFIKRYEQIEKFTATINDIADQTNLLALNAAIEAARAGESGRGFAVVADEVRKLSLKTTDSTKEIKTVISGLNAEMKQIGKIISENVSKIDAGVEITGETIENFNYMNNHIREIVELVDGVLRSMEEENLAISDISHNITGVSHKLEGLLHSSEEFVRAGDSLRSISNEMDDELKEINVGKTDELISWSKKIETGIKKFDDQHKELVRLLNKFYTAINEGRSKAVLGEILNELANYTVYHFQSEEDAFRLFNFPEKDEHIRIHKDLVNQVLKVIKDFESGKDVVSVNLLQFLKEWVVKHIMGDDMKYAKYFKETGANIR